jgi:drug/metabolite transporter (DMT)-like permease
MSSRSHSTTGLLEEFTVLVAPGTFVILWASGFIGAKLGLPYAEPLTFLLLRMIGAVLLLGVFILYARPKWPDRNGVFDAGLLCVHFQPKSERREDGHRE